jgi:hypothetical protein
VVPHETSGDRRCVLSVSHGGAECLARRSAGRCERRSHLIASPSSPTATPMPSSRGHRASTVAPIRPVERLERARCPTVGPPGLWAPWALPWHRGKPGRLVDAFGALPVAEVIRAAIEASDAVSPPWGIAAANLREGLAITH